MISVTRADGLYEVTVTESCKAPAYMVYDLLADLRSHMEWGGRRVPVSGQRLTSIQAPDGLATAGVEFDSVGATASGEWHDHSRLTISDRRQEFEFVTKGTLEYRPGRAPIRATSIHHYDIESNPEGCTVVYQLHLTQFEGIGAGGDFPHPAVFFNVVVPWNLERGVRNLIAVAEERHAAAEAS
jgi:hypothetical protein